MFDNEVTAYSKSHAAMHYESVARLRNTYMMKVLYSVTRIDATHTHVYYMTTTEGQNFFGRLMVFLTPKKKNRTIVSDFLRNLKKVALEDYRKKENETSQFPYR
ncbi:hypothetical protein [Macrococcus carouselicus]|uniref:Uncharacterized protein n=1 Tax=Macrococcus carouselicus TaxID=69969 RepID=A0A9Q8FR07_9STAP|nr:hypothetical protein [Macrococcus carouselicus]TDM02490.1 hypothetical protein ERX40_08010 [Macrococcus carouselicus]